jgi:uncharacterized alkaline shock family protein YloU
MGPPLSGEEMDEREIGRVVRNAAESVYGVVAVVGPGWFEGVRTRLNIGNSGVSVSRSPVLAVTVDLRVAEAVPQNQVASNVAEKVRYVVERDLGVHIAALTIRVDGRPVATDQHTDSHASPGAHETTKP